MKLVVIFFFVKDRPVTSKQRMAGHFLGLGGPASPGPGPAGLPKLMKKS